MKRKSKITWIIIEYLTEIPGVNHAVSVHDLTALYADNDNLKVNIDAKDLGLGKNIYKIYSNRIRSIMFRLMDNKPSPFGKIKVNGSVYYYKI